MSEETVPTPEYIATYKLHVFHTMGGRYEVEVSELGRFRGYDLAATLANGVQAVVYQLYEEQKRVELLRPAEPV